MALEKGETCTKGSATVATDLLTLKVICSSDLSAKFSDNTLKGFTSYLVEVSLLVSQCTRNGIEFTGRFKLFNVDHMRLFSFRHCLAKSTSGLSSFQCLRTILSQPTKLE